MVLPNVISELVRTQNSHDSLGYANCFSETGIMYDEGKVHTGRAEIEQWMTRGNEKYKTVMKPIEFREEGATSILSAEVSGTFDGSPIVLQYHIDIVDGLIRSLKVTV